MCACDGRGGALAPRRRASVKHRGRTRASSAALALRRLSRGACDGAGCGGESGRLLCLFMVPFIIRVVEELHDLLEEGVAVQVPIVSADARALSCGLATSLLDAVILRREGRWCCWWAAFKWRQPPLVSLMRPDSQRAHGGLTEVSEAQARRRCLQ